MRAVVQRVLSASVTIDGVPAAAIGVGLLVLAGIHRDDLFKDIEYITSKIAGLRIFDDSAGNMNLSIADAGGEILAVSQFTLYGDARKGKRPSYSEAMPPDQASEFFALFVAELKKKYSQVKTGVFGADMKVSLVNSGPVTILLDSSRLF